MVTYVVEGSRSSGGRSENVYKWKYMNGISNMWIDYLGLKGGYFGLIPSNAELRTEIISLEVS